MQCRRHVPALPLGKQLRDIVDKDLYKDADAAHFRKPHGSGMHDLSQTLVVGSSQIASSANGLTMQIIIKAFDLDKALEILDRQRLRIQDPTCCLGNTAARCTKAYWPAKTT